MADLSKGEQEFLAHPFGWLQIASQVDQHELWQTSSSPVAAVDSAVKKLPRGTKLLQRGANGNEVFADYQLPANSERSLSTREVSFQAIGDATGTAVRVDAEVAYVAPRPQDQRIPSDARELDITVGSNLRRPLVSLKVSNIAEIRRVAGMVNMLPVNDYEKGVFYNCPVSEPSTPLDRLVFRSSRTGPVLASLTEVAGTPKTADPCASTTLIIRGHHKLELQDGGLLLENASSVLGVRLNRG